MLYGTPTGPTASGDDWIHQDVDGIPGIHEPDDRFGSSVAAADTDGDGIDDLVIGVAGEALGPIDDTGYILIVPGSADGPDPEAAAGIHQERPPTDTNEPGDEFGAVLGS